MILAHMNPHTHLDILHMRQVKMSLLGVILSHRSEPCNSSIFLFLPMIVIGGGGSKSKSGIGGTTKSGMSGILGAGALISVIKNQKYKCGHAHLCCVKFVRGKQLFKLHKKPVNLRVIKFKNNGR